MESSADVELPIHCSCAGRIGSEGEQGGWHRWAISPEVPIGVIDLHHIEALSNLAFVSTYTANPTYREWYTEMR